MIDIYHELARISTEGDEAALVTVISASGSTPREVGTKMLVKADGNILGSIGGGSVEKRVIKEAIKVIRTGRPQRFSYRLKKGGELGMICGGDIEVFIEPTLSIPTMYIFGGGHIALCLAKMGKLAGFKIAVVDDRGEFASPQRFPEADLTITDDFAKAVQSLKIDRSSYIVIVTYSHKCDEIVLEEAFTTQAKYIGMIGSKTKIRVIFSHLLAKGIPQKQLDRIHAPIGLEIYSQTPEEIAVSILAEVIKVRRSPSP